MQVGEVLSDGTPVIYASVSGHAPCEFTANWTGRPGPFVYFVGSGLLSTPPSKSENSAGVAAYGIIMPNESHD